jgi:hypothetical protein
MMDDNKKLNNADEVLAWAKANASSSDKYTIEKNGILRKTGWHRWSRSDRNVTLSKELFEKLAEKWTKKQSYGSYVFVGMRTAVGVATLICDPQAIKEIKAHNTATAKEQKRIQDLSRQATRRTNAKAMASRLLKDYGNEYGSMTLAQIVELPDIEVK